jgi:hypothetical protein
MKACEIFAVLSASLLWAGCDDRPFDAKAASAEVVKVPMPASQPVLVGVIPVQESTASPASGSYEDGGLDYTRTIHNTHFGIAAGEKAGDALKGIQSFKDDQPAPPAIENPAPGLWKTSKGSKGSFGGGATDELSWWDRLIRGLRTWTGIAVIGAIVLVVMFFIPATRPIASAIWRGIVWIVGLPGALYEWWIGRRRQQVAQAQADTAGRQRDEIISGGQAFKDAIKSATWLTADAREKVLALFKDKQMGAQDADTQKAVKLVKAGS